MSTYRATSIEQENLGNVKKHKFWGLKNVKFLQYYANYDFSIALIFF